MWLLGRASEVVVARGSRGMGVREMEGGNRDMAVEEGIREVGG